MTENWGRPQSLDNKYHSTFGVQYICESLTKMVHSQVFICYSGKIKQYQCLQMWLIKAWITKVMVRVTNSILMDNYSQPVKESNSFFKAVKTSMGQIELMCVAEITAKAHRNVAPSKPREHNVKSSDGSLGRVLVSRVWKSACVMVFSSHVYERPAKLENQREADAKERTALLCRIGIGTLEQWTLFYPSVDWGREYQSLSELYRNAFFKKHRVSNKCFILSCA